MPSILRRAGPLAGGAFGRHGRNLIGDKIALLGGGQDPDAFDRPAFHSAPYSCLSVRDQRRCDHAGGIQSTGLRHVYESILWAAIHGVLSWLYVGYYVLTR